MSLLAVVAVFAISTIGYHVLCEASFSDSAYMTIITLSTVGHHEIIPLDGGGRLWTSLMIVFGIATISVAFTSLLTVLVSGNLLRLRGRYRMETRVSHLEKHVIICGGGRMGMLTAADLKQRRVPLVIIEQDPTVADELESKGYLYALGDATDEETLVSAGLSRARALVAVLPRDSDNVYISLTARGLHADLQIVSRAEHPSTEIKLKRAGADRVVLPHVVGATRIANLLTRPSVLDFLELAGEGMDLEVDEYVIAEQSRMKNKTLRSSGLRQEAGVTVVAIKKADGAMIFSPDPDELIESADTLIMVGPAGASSRLDRMGL